MCQHTKASAPKLPQCRNRSTNNSGVPCACWAAALFDVVDPRRSRALCLTQLRAIETTGGECTKRAIRVAVGVVILIF